MFVSASTSPRQTRRAITLTLGSGGYPTPASSAVAHRQPNKLKALVLENRRSHYHSIHYFDLIRSWLGDPQDVYARTEKNPHTESLAATKTIAILNSRL